MKILLVSPHINAQHQVVQLLKAKGMAVLLPTTAATSGPAFYDEAWKIIQTHGPSLDLVVLHRETPKGLDSGIELVSKIKKDPVQQDLPILLTTEVWSEEECASHQQTPMGANAYLKWPAEDSALIQTIDAILPSEEGQRTSTAVRLDRLAASAPAEQSVELEPAEAPATEYVLEEPAQIFSNKTQTEISQSSIQLNNSDVIEFTSPRMTLPPAAPADATSVAVVMPENESGISIQVSSPGSMPGSAPGSIDGSIDVDSSAPAVQTEGQSLHGLSMETEAPGAIDLAGGVSLVGEAATSVVQPPVEDSSIATSGSTSGAAPAASGISSRSTSLESEPAAEGTDLGSSLETQMPYLFSPKGKSEQGSVNPAVVSTFAHPLGDAIIPGGAVTSPDIETLKKYLLLREQDVAALSVQLKNAKDEATSLNHHLMAESSRAEELESIVSDQKRKIDDFEKEKAIALETLNSEIAEIRFQSKAKNDKAKLLEIQVQEASNEIERLKERVRSDIRKIRVRERELENKLEITKKDSEVVLAARENKIIELKRKIDLLEFNMDLLQDRYSREKDSTAKLREKLAKAAQVVRVAEGLLDDPQAASLKQTVETLTAESTSTSTQGNKAS
jgi:hypothetical protein